MNNEAPPNEHNNLTEHMDRSNILNGDVLMEQRIENQTLTAPDDDANGG